ELTPARAGCCRRTASSGPKTRPSRRSYQANERFLPEGVITLAEFLDPGAFDLPDINKAIDTTERPLIRQDLESIVTRVDMKGTPLRKRWSRIKANGLTHEYTQRTSLGTPEGGAFYADGQPPPDGPIEYLLK